MNKKDLRILYRCQGWWYTHRLHIQEAEAEGQGIRKQPEETKKEKGENVIIWSWYSVTSLSSSRGRETLRTSRQHFCSCGSGGDILAPLKRRSGS